MSDLDPEWLSSKLLRRGHFRLESNHHSDLWLELELLCSRPDSVRPLALDLASSLAKYKLDAVCGPLVEGAFLGFLVAEALRVEFLYSEREVVATDQVSLYPVEYRLPAAQRRGRAGKRVAIVNDVINAGSAVRGTFSDLESVGAHVAAVATLLTLGSAGPEFAASKAVPFISLTTQTNNLWLPSACPLCTEGIPLQEPGD